MTNNQRVNIQLFWRLFLDVEYIFTKGSHEEGAKRDALDKLSEALSLVAKGLFIEYSEKTTTSKGEFIITAQGEATLFPLVDEVIKAAPSSSVDWDFIALKQRQADFEHIQYEGVGLRKDQLWFMPHFSKLQPTLIGLVVGIHPVAYLKGQDSAMTFAVLKVLDTLLGERLAAAHITLLDIVPLPEMPEDIGYIEFEDLYDYLVWELDQR